MNCLQSLPRVPVSHSGRFSAQTCSQQHRTPRVIHVRGGAGRDRKQTLLPGPRGHVYSTSSAPINTNSLDIFIWVFYVAVPPPPPPPHTHTHTLTCSKSSGGSPAVFSHPLGISMDIILGGQADKVIRTCGGSHSDICVHTSTSSGENVKDLQGPVLV